MSKHPQKPSTALARFIHHESASGMVMIVSGALAIFFANSPYAANYHYLLELGFDLSIAGFDYPMTLAEVVKDIFMAFFFLLVGMELKREMLEGSLATHAQRLLPLVAALAGIITPAAIYLVANHGLAANQPGWAIPTATDIAFALCVLTLVGRGIPTAAKIFLLAIAIYDDLAAIIIIAVFYNHGLSLVPLLLGAGLTGIMALMSRQGIRPIPFYLLLGMGLWFCLHAGGVHTTVAGMITGLCIPLRPGGPRDFSPLHWLERKLHPWIAFFVLPLFAFTAAGVSFEGITPAMLLAPLPLGIAFGLFFGKQIGIFGVTWAAIRLGFAQRPQHTSWAMLYGISIIAGVGFTMSLLVGMLAFTDPLLQNEVKLGVIAGSLLSTVWGALVLRWAATRRSVSPSGKSPKSAA